MIDPVPSQIEPFECPACGQKSATPPDSNKGMGFHVEERGRRGLVIVCNQCDNIIPAKPS